MVEVTDFFGPVEIVVLLKLLLKNPRHFFFKIL